MIEETTQDEFDRLLDDFIAKQLSETEDSLSEIKEIKENEKPQPSSNYPQDEDANALFNEEKQLYNAYHNFKCAITDMAQASSLELPPFEFSAKLLYPRFRPSRINELNNDICNGWKIMLTAQPVRLSSLPNNASDEQILNFAEKTTDATLQNALISYVEVLIELDSCEIAYHLRKAKAEKRKIEKQIYEEHLQRKEKMQKFIEAIKAKNFPIDAERLVNNFFKSVRKDPEGAQKILETNPATYAPIQVEKIPPRFFGMIKPKPEDGIRINKEIGKFLKNLKA
ncbi:MAG: hypothetical protein E7018_06490 [Alphaproteobacteria bacterium]|nr:hypothetical protein [Alphaproteobacteria bacterium]MBE6448922.1 hypothetical protein [Alphaproteobacteria bacterium]